jgi:hypothetical protein
MASIGAGTRVVVAAADLPEHGMRGTVLGHYASERPLMLVKLDDGEYLLTQITDLAAADAVREPSAAA